MSPRHIDEATFHARVEEILDSALDIISRLGIAALTMDKLVGSVCYSKGTIYNHFSSKEDVLAALCNRNMRAVMQLFVRAAAIDAKNRDKMTAISFAYMLSALLSPQHFSLVMNAKTELFEQASEARREEHEKLDKQLFGVMCGTIEDAIEKRELILKPGVDAQQVSFTLWSMAFGTIGLLFNGEKACSTTTGMILEDRVIEHGNIAMNGMGWAVSQRDPIEFIQWLKTDIFTAEVQTLQTLGIHLKKAEPSNP